MAIGERIRFFRNLKGLTQKQLGIKLGYKEKTADIRMAQYESGKRSPKSDTIGELSSIFGVSPQALDVPDIDSYIGLMHTLFTLEDRYGIHIDKIDGEICMRLDRRNVSPSSSVPQMLAAWQEQSEKLENGDITKDQYDQWRYNYPRFDTTQRWARTPSKEFSDALCETFKDRLKPD